jgi:hypothetical protein
MEEASQNGFTLRMAPSGMALLPTKDGKPMQEADYLALSTAEKKTLEDKRGEIEEKVEAALREGRKLEREITEKLAAVETQAGEYLVGSLAESGRNMAISRKFLLTWTEARSYSRI